MLEKSEEDQLEDKARMISMEKGISFQDAMKLARGGQKSIFDF